MTINDTKCGKKYCRTFRYMLSGTINVDSYQAQHFDGINLSEGIKEHFRKDSVFVGRLAIVTELMLKPTMIEVGYLEKLRELSLLKDDFVYSRDVLDDSMETLSGKRTDMLNVWKAVVERMRLVVNDEKNKRPTFEFDLLLTRDGILLIRDITKDEWRQVYAAPGTADDYKNNIPIHRVFKMAANYVKYLFHSNYHHNGNHDTYLPASNLNSITPDKDGFRRVFRHQMNAFLGPVSSQKRNWFNDFPIEPNGILLYAKSFVNVCHNNGLIDDDAFKQKMSFIDIQIKEIDLMTASRRGVIASVLSQSNIVFLVSGVLAFMVAVIKIVTTFFDFQRQNFWNTWVGVCNGTISEGERDVLLRHIAGIVFLVFIGVSLYYFYFRWKASKRFRPQCVGRSWLMVDSNLTKGRLSYFYMFYLWLQNLKLRIGKKRGNVFMAAFYVLSLVVTFGVAIYILL